MAKKISTNPIDKNIFRVCQCLVRIMHRHSTANIEECEDQSQCQFSKQYELLPFRRCLKNAESRIRVVDSKDSIFQQFFMFYDSASDDGIPHIVGAGLRVEIVARTEPNEWGVRCPFGSIRRAHLMAESSGFVLPPTAC